MKILGKILSESRTKSGLTILELSNTLKISSHYLEAIEQGKYKNTPGDPYTLGFIKSYGNYFSLDVELLIEIYRDETQHVIKAGSLNLPSIGYSSKYFNYFKYGFASLILLFVAFSFNYLFLEKAYYNQNYAIAPELDASMLALLEKEELRQDLIYLNKIKNENEKARINVEKQSNKINKDQVNTQQKDTRSAIAAVDDENISSNKEIFVLNFLGDTWIHIKDKNKDVMISKLMKEKEQFILEYKKIYYITTGNAGNIEVLFNNKRLGKLGKKGEILNSLSFSSENFEN